MDPTNDVMDWTFNPFGSDLDVNIKEFIDKIPEDFFYPHMYSQKPIPTHPTNIIITPELDIQHKEMEYQRKKQEELKALQDLEVKKELEKMEEEVREKQRLEAEKKLEEEKSIQQEHIEQENRKKLEIITKFVDLNLSRPTQTLLKEFYDPKEDDHASLIALHHFEKTGTFLHQKREEIDEEFALKEYQARKEAEKEEKPVISVELPPNLPKDPKDLASVLQDLENAKRQAVDKMNQEKRENSLKILLSLQNRPEIQKNPDWKEYLDMNFVKPTEKIVFERIHQVYDPFKDPTLNLLHHADAIIDIKNRNLFQYDNSLIEEDLLKTWIKSKL